VSLLRVYYGTYTGAGSRGLYTGTLDFAAGTLSDPRVAAEAEQPSFAAFHPNGAFLYAVNEHEVFDGQPTGTISAFAVDTVTGGLAFLGRQVSHGASPCHVAVEAQGRHVLVANYHGGSVASFPINGRGALGPATTVVRHSGSGPDRARQEQAHAHSAHFDRTGRFVLAVDLGIDKVLVYRFDGDTGALTPHDPPYAALPPGSGPRHLAFHPSGPYVYVDNELSATVTAFRYDGDLGRLTEIETRPTLPADFSGANTSAEIQCSPDGRHLYVSNRGHDTIALFAVDAATGRLTPGGHVSTRGRAPRHFAIEPSGRYLVAANQDSDKVVLFRRDAASGGLEPTGSEIHLSRPVCVRFAPR
jgi:6-phosphogluconolactonase